MGFRPTEAEEEIIRRRIAEGGYQSTAAFIREAALQHASTATSDASTGILLKVRDLLQKIITIIDAEISS